MHVRIELLHQIASAIRRLPGRSVVRVAVDGVDGAGKTTFADELAATLDSLGAQTIRASVRRHLPAPSGTSCILGLLDLPRGAQRGNGPSDPNAEENRRYVDGQKIYLDECNPKSLATMIINNENLAAPRVIVL
jgi:hypothetical protein